MRWNVPVDFLYSASIGIHPEHIRIGIGDTMSSNVLLLPDAPHRRMGIHKKRPAVTRPNGLAVWPDGLECETGRVFFKIMENQDWQGGIALLDAVPDVGAILPIGGDMGGFLQHRLDSPPQYDPEPVRPVH